jgi:hypothetical protein
VIHDRACVREGARSAPKQTSKRCVCSVFVVFEVVYSPRMHAMVCEDPAGELVELVCVYRPATPLALEDN